MNPGTLQTMVAGTLLLVTATPTLAQPDFQPHPNNPVLAYGAGGAWDSGVVYLPEVVAHDSTYYLFYSASENLMTTPLAIGVATSADGVAWTKHAANPVFTADGTGFDAWLVAASTLLLEEGTWILYYNARSQPGPGPGPAIGRATADAPDGPWTRTETPVLAVGDTGAWDDGFVTPNAVLKTEGGYVMYYSGGPGFPATPANGFRYRLGMATSSDGITWAKHDDPATTDPLFAESDPVLDVGPPGSYDSGLAWAADVLQTDAGWEMAYTCDPDTFPFESICYATSADGLTWAKSDANPIFQHTQDGEWASFEVILGSLILIDGVRHLYYIGTTTFFDGQIGLAIDAATTSQPMIRLK